jgi:hypothetical protein
VDLFKNIGEDENNVVALALDIEMPERELAKESRLL